VGDSIAEESVTKLGYCYRVVRSAHIDGKIMGTFKLLSYNFFFEWGVVDWYALVE